eukprot:8336794-Pyramimonas_sp.AAC.1
MLQESVHGHGQPCTRLDTPNRTERATTKAPKSHAFRASAPGNDYQVEAHSHLSEVLPQVRDKAFEASAQAKRLPKPDDGIVMIHPCRAVDRVSAEGGIDVVFRALIDVPNV